MSENLADLLEKLPAYLGGHMLLSLLAMALGLLISLPLGVFASRRPRWGEWILGVASVLQTVPSLALLALMVLLLGGQIGFLPAFIALVLYSILPILANTITGIRGVDPALIEAARGLGMSERQMLFRVQLPLAAPVIISGIRTATVLVVGTATLVTPVGGVSLGNYIFGGLESLNHLSTVFGCVMAALLAIVLDQCVRLFEVAARRHSRSLTRTAGIVLGVVLACGLYAPTAQLLAGGGSRARLATGPFTEQHILSEVLKQRLKEEGITLDQRMGMSEGIQFEALFQSKIDGMVNYTGNVWTLLMKRGDPVSRQATLAEVTEWMRQRDIVCLPLGFENAYAIAVTSETARKMGGSLKDLSSHARRLGRPLSIAGDNQIFLRREWRRVMEFYGLPASAVKELSMSPTLMYDALKNGEVDAIVAYTSDGRIPLYRLVLLDDPKQAFPPYDAILLLSPSGSRNERLRAALQPLVGNVRQEIMQQANQRVDVDGRTPRAAAGELLRELAGPQ